MGTIARDYPRLMKVHMQVQDLPELRDYLTSSLRLPFNEEGIFRYYPELDGECEKPPSYRRSPLPPMILVISACNRSEERRVGKAFVSSCSSRWSPCH